MSEPFLAEIRMFGFNFAPRGWAFCDGQILPINQNQSLFSLLGTIYGGDGRTSFALPELRGRVPIHVSTLHRQGQRSGEETHVLNVNEIPAHSHSLAGSGDQATSNSPAGNALASRPRRTASYYAAPGNPTAMRAGSIGTSAGGGQAHENMQPYVAVHYAIALQGLFPSRN